MPRKSRLDAAGALHHIMVRGIERGAVFRDDTDRNGFLERLGDILQDAKSICHALTVRELKVPLSSLGSNIGYDDSGSKRFRSPWPKDCRGKRLRQMELKYLTAHPFRRGPYRVLGWFGLCQSRHFHPPVGPRR